MFGDLDWPWNESCAFVNISINCQLFSNFRFIVRHICYYLVSLNIIICVSLFLYLYLSLSSSPLLSLSISLAVSHSLIFFRGIRIAISLELVDAEQMSPIQRCFRDLVCQPLVTSCDIDAYLCLAILHAWILECQYMTLCVWWLISTKAES